MVCITGQLRASGKGRLDLLGAAILQALLSGSAAARYVGVHMIIFGAYIGAVKLCESLAWVTVSPRGSVRKELFGQELGRTACVAAKGCYTGKGWKCCRRVACGGPMCDFLARAIGGPEHGAGPVAGGNA